MAPSKSQEVVVTRGLLWRSSSRSMNLRSMTRRTLMMEASSTTKVVTGEDVAEVAGVEEDLEEEVVEASIK